MSVEIEWRRQLAQGRGESSVVAQWFSSRGPVGVLGVVLGTMGLDPGYQFCVPRRGRRR